MFSKMDKLSTKEDRLEYLKKQRNKTVNTIAQKKIERLIKKEEAK